MGKILGILLLLLNFVIIKLAIDACFGNDAHLFNKPFNNMKGVRVKLFSMGYSNRRFLMRYFL